MISMGRVGPIELSWFGFGAGFGAVDEVLMESGSGAGLLVSSELPHRLWKVYKELTWVYVSCLTSLRNDG